MPKTKKPTKRRVGAGPNGRVPRQRVTLSPKELGRYIVADQGICHGKPTFKGTRIMVTNVLELLAEGMDWDRITWEYHGKISREAIAEAIHLAGEALEKHERLPAPEWS